MAATLTTEVRDEKLLNELRKHVKVDSEAYKKIVDKEESLDAEYKESKKQLREDKKKYVQHAYGIVSASRALGIDIKSEVDLLFHGEEVPIEEQPEKKKRAPKALRPTEEDGQITF